ncbi:MAG: helix-turn-helix domain-containing protein [Anaerolineae bacterium]
MADPNPSINHHAQEHIIKGSADEWNALVSSALGELETRPVDLRRTFSGRLAHRSLGDLICVNLRSNRLDVIRQERFISDAREDFFKVNFNLAGTARLEQDGRQTLLNPGDWVVYDNTRPYRLSFGDDYQQLVVLVPRSHFLAKLPDIHRLTVEGQQANSGLGRTAWNYLIGNKTPNDSRTADIVTDLILGSLLENKKGSPNFSLSPAAKLVLIKQFIQHHLGDSNLGVEMICAHMHISRRYLHHLFKIDEVTVGNYIWQCRLEKTRLDLTSPEANHLTTAEIGYRWGFSSSAHFSRRFKQAFGQSPTQHRSSSAVRNSIYLQ